MLVVRPLLPQHGGLHEWHQRDCWLAVRPVWARDDFQTMSRWVAEVDTPAAMVGVDLAGQSALRIGPVRDPTGDDAPVNRVETVVVHEKGIMLHLNVGG